MSIINSKKLNRRRSVSFSMDKIFLIRFDMLILNYVNKTTSDTTK